jgi:predicted Zn-dependent protease
VGACRLRGRLADLLGAVVAVGGEARLAGAGWCAKGGQKLPVWAHTPSIHLAGATLESR